MAGLPCANCGAGCAQVGGSSSVRVAVRCRPFNTREKEMEQELIVNMEGARAGLPVALASSEASRCGL